MKHHLEQDVRPDPELDPGLDLGLPAVAEAGPAAGAGADRVPGQEADEQVDRARRLADFGPCWAEAERRGDVAALDALLTEDFTAVGPRGFVLDKAKWLERYASGSLVHDSFTWDEVKVRQYGRSAVAVGVQGQQSVFEGRDADGDFRITQTIVEVDGHWRLAAVHLSPSGAHEY